MDSTRRKVKSFKASGSKVGQKGINWRNTKDTEKKTALVEHHLAYTLEAAWNSLVLGFNCFYFCLSVISWDYCQFISPTGIAKGDNWLKGRWVTLKILLSVNRENSR